MEELKDTLSEKNHFGLSEREMDVLKLVARGTSNKQIGEALFISENTVKVHIHRIIRKLNVQNRFEAAILAIRENIIQE